MASERFCVSGPDQKKLILVFVKKIEVALMKMVMGELMKKILVFTPCRRHREPKNFANKKYRLFLRIIGIYAYCLKCFSIGLTNQPDSIIHTKYNYCFFLKALNYHSAVKYLYVVR